MSRTSPLLAHLRLLCSLDIGSRMIVPPALTALKAWVPHSAGVFLWGNPAGKVVAACASDPEMHRIAGRFAADYARESGADQDWPGFAGLTSGREIFQADFTQHPSGPTSHPVHDALMRPAGLTRLLACPIIARSGANAALLLLRGAHDVPFNGEDKGRIAEVLPRLGATIDRRRSTYEFVDDGGPGGILVVGPAGELLHACDQGRQLLHLAACPDELDQGALQPSEVALLTRVANLARNTGEFPGGNPVSFVEVEGECGQFQLRARRLNGIGNLSHHHVGISIHRRIPVPLKIAQRLDRFSLSPRLRELALLLGSNLKNDTVADRLGLRPSTVAGMVKDLYLRIGVNNRQALREALLTH